MASLLLFCQVHATEFPGDPAALKMESRREPDAGFLEWLLPRSLQKNPRLEVTVITEATPAGREMETNAPPGPKYFAFHNAGYQRLKHGTTTRITLEAADVEKLLTKSLATNGFLPGEPPTKPPSLLIIYTWGLHERNPDLDGHESVRAIMDRATLVGGEKFARKLIKLLEEAEVWRIANAVPIAEGAESPLAPGMDFLNPIEAFRRADPRNEFLIDQTRGDVYYVVASAYDYRMAAENRRVLLWRTRMTVATEGVSQLQSLPVVIAAAAPFLGKEMDEPAILTPRTLREGKVEIGESVVVPDTAAAPSAPNR